MFPNRYLPVRPSHPHHLFRGNSAKRQSIWRIYATAAGRKRAIKYFVKQGYRYFVRWLDVNGFGLEADYRAQWQPQDEDCHTHLD